MDRLIRWKAVKNSGRAGSAYLSAFSLILLLISGTGSLSFAEDWKLIVSATYETGEYGTDTETDTLYVPLTLRRYFDMGDFSVTIPYISQKSTGLVTVVDGMVFRFRKVGRVPVATNSGLGDIILKGSLYLLEEHRKQPLDLSLIGKIKLPTADEDKGLGTGEYDETIGLATDKALMHGGTLFVDVYYTFTGDPSGEDFKNRFSFDVGLAGELTEGLLASVFYEESTPIISGVTNVRDIVVNLDYEVSKGTKVFAGGSIGLTESSPDYGITAGVSFRF